MKKILKFLAPLMILAVFLASLPTAVAAEQKALQMSLTKPTAFEDPYTVEFEQSMQNSGMHKGLLQSDSGVTYDYVYLKEYNMDNSPADSPFLTVSFAVNKTGEYDFLIELMAHPGEKKRTGLFQIDDGEKYYVSTVHGERNLVTEYYTGMSAQLTQGVHKMTVYLGDDFNDDTVKSVFLDRFSYVLVEDEQQPPPPPSEEDGKEEGGENPLPGEGEGEQDPPPQGEGEQDPPPSEEGEQDPPPSAKDLQPSSGCNNAASVSGVLALLGVIFLIFKGKTF